MSEQKLHVSLDELGKIASGAQRVIVQLHDQRRKKLVVGDTLLLIDKEKHLQQAEVSLTGFKVFKSFVELFTFYGPKALGALPTTSCESFVAELHKTFYHRDEERLGVIALELALERKLSVVWQDPFNGKVLFTLMPHEDYKKVFPVKQSYGFCFNEDGQILIGKVKSAHKGKWILPGGTIESGEDPVKALHRELDEEVCITIFKPTLIGMQKAEFFEKNETLYQLRFVARIKKLLDLTPDPDNGDVWERKFIAPEDFQRYIPWGIVGQVFVDRAVAWFKEEQKKQKKDLVSSKNKVVAKPVIKKSVKKPAVKKSVAKSVQRKSVSRGSVQQKSVMQKPVKQKSVQRKSVSRGSVMQKSVLKPVVKKVVVQKLVVKKKK